VSDRPPSSASKRLDLPELLAALASRRAGGERVVLTNGAFDLLHVGHLRSLERARGLGDMLVVGLNSDASIRAYKDTERPVLPEDERAELLAGLACVDYVVVFGEPTAERLVAALQPDIYVKGADYTTKALPERAVVEEYGGTVALVDLEAGRSTSGLIDEIVRRFSKPTSSPCDR
jgi:rfaE bifunctional protein nucleotidyltransferase chain/domain